MNFFHDFSGSKALSGFFFPTIDYLFINKIKPLVPQIDIRHKFFLNSFNDVLYLVILKMNIIFH